MSILTLTVNTPSPALDRKFQEVALIAQALGSAAHEIQSHQGQQTSGNIIGAGGITIGSWSYTANASS